MKHLRGSIRFAGFFSLVLLFLAHHGLLRVFIWDENRRLKWYLTSIKRYSALGLKLLGIEVDHHRRPQTPGRKLLVANHLSYVDVLVFFSLYPALFVTSQEIRETALLGQITQLAGCFFVERRRPKRISGTVARELQDMKQKLAAGFDVFLFPEGTSTDGSTVLPFKAPFFQMAIDAEVEVKPLLIKYAEADRGVAAWYGDMTFADHLYGVCAHPGLRVSVSELATVKPRRDDDRMELAQLCHRRIYEAHAP